MNPPTNDPSLREKKDRHGGPDKSVADLFRLDDRTVISKSMLSRNTIRPSQVH